ncbi:hypothetical protein ADINL_0713 [Nitrincola lacisaponensis]|uniref:Uncharacterized protein n=1 Tax=Nitrincola lacisaponensis TaxID=267850 RepID=A0A063Y5S2_9GAMM|nr:hypothetical protein ADINL_0713 [Nitrincola lacisaponensis]
MFYIALSNPCRSDLQLCPSQATSGYNPGFNPMISPEGGSV